MQKSRVELVFFESEWLERWKVGWLYWSRNAFIVKSGEVLEKDVGRWKTFWSKPGRHMEKSQLVFIALRFHCIGMNQWEWYEQKRLKSLLLLNVLYNFKVLKCCDVIQKYVYWRFHNYRTLPELELWMRVLTGWKEVDVISTSHSFFVLLIVTSLNERQLKLLPSRLVVIRREIENIPRNDLGILLWATIFTTFTICKSRYS